MIVPAHDYQRSRYHSPAKPLQGTDAALNHLIGRFHRRSSRLKQLRKDAEAIDALAPSLAKLSEGHLHQRLMELRGIFRRGGDCVVDHVLPALAAIREAADRNLGMRPFIVQLMGALALHRGYLAEMATGEGKTLTAGLAAVLAGWTKRPCHIVTVNDYLVERDAERLSPLYIFCGVRVGCITGSMEQAARVKGHACDVTYTTSKELLADFLRDRIRLGDLHHPTRRLIRHLLSGKPQREPENAGLVMRGLHTAIIDEADSVLIDEAVTPLIISAVHENNELKEAGRIAHQIVSKLLPGEHYEVKPRYKEIELTAAGQKRIEQHATALPGLWQGSERRMELVIQALVAREFFHRDKQYIVSNEKVVIVDEFTGRPMPQRTWREGMHQAIEAKEGLIISNPSETIARLSFQRFFRCFFKLSGMTGTAKETAGEFWQAYRLPVVRIPTNRPCVRRQGSDRIFAEEKQKWEAIVAEIERVHTLGRPILVGTRSVLASERLSEMLATRKLEHHVLNATRLWEEAAIVSLAGERARITIATNMAGRGTDILLGNGVVTLGGLHVIATERHESGRVDRQLFGRSARQGDPGSAQAFVSLEDELILRYLPLATRKLLRLTYSLSPRLAGIGFGMAQGRAQRLAAKQRQRVLQTDLWLDQALSFAGSNSL